MATIKAIVRSGTSNVRKDGTRRVYIRITHKRSVRFIPTEIYVKSSQLTQKLAIKDAQVKMRCQELELEYTRRVQELGLDLVDMDIEEIYRRVTGRTRCIASVPSFTEYFEGVWAEEHKSLKGMKNYLTAFNAFCSYLGKRKILPEELTPSVMRGFERWLLSKGRKRAVSLYTSSIHRVFNDMREDFCDEDGSNALIRDTLRKYTAPKPNVAEKRALDVDTIRRIFALPYDGKLTPNGLQSARDLALDCFKLSFCLMGMNAADLFEASSCKGRVITYYRVKTRERRADRAEMRVAVHSTIKDVFARQRGSKRVFRFCERFALLSSFEKVVNQGLKIVGAEVGVKGLQFYAARHSMATIAYNDVGIPLSVVDEMLCHKSRGMAVTEKYIKKDFTHINEANAKLLAFVFGE